MMGAIVVTIAVAVSLSTGLMIGVMAMVAMAVRREDTQNSLTRQAPGVVTRGVRRLTGVGLRDITPPVEPVPSGVWVRP